MPGSNWHVYVRDPDGHTVELYYGMEQIGVSGRAKPFDMYYRRFMETRRCRRCRTSRRPPRPKAKGIDVASATN